VSEGTICPYPCAVSERPQSFESKADAEAFCREREADDPEAHWISWQAEGAWIALRTNLPRTTDPLGSHTEGKPRSPEAEDPRSGPGRNLPGTGYF
jgi:hypothetical protein